MNLNDQEILELTELCSAVIDGTLTGAQRTRLGDWLTRSDDARGIYVRILGQSASLHHYAAERQTDAVDPTVSTRTPFVRRTLWALAFAASIAVILGIWLNRSAPASTAAGSVAQLTGSRDCEWSGKALVAGARVQRGQRLELSKGVAEITFDSGARVLLEAPASLEVNSAWDGTLRRGTLRATVPHEAIGFRISNPSVEVVDLGTEFTMIADPAGTAEVLVSKGEVEAAPRSSGDADSILLKEKESRKFAASGVTPVDNPGQVFAASASPVALDRFTQATHFARWSLEETMGDRFVAETGGLPETHDFDLTVQSDGKKGAAGVHVVGRDGSALHFDGQTYVKGFFPGISGSGTKTVSFWVRVPTDAQLSDSFAMIGWATVVQKLNLRPVHIGWNRNPNEGNLGAIRTDFGGGSAIGTTSLKDGKWHHVAVVFAPGLDDSTPVQVKQYLDGRLESGAIIPGVVHAPHGDPDQTAAIKDIVWLGCRIGLSAPRRDRFRGDLQDLFIADRGLEPQEIVSLMTTHRLPAATLLALSDRDTGN